MRRKLESGQALVLTAVAMVALLGVMGLAIDMGVLRYDKRLQQTAADAAAIAGAADLGHNSAGSAAIITAAQTASSSNGFADNNSNGTSCPSSTASLPSNLAIGTVEVTVCNPPIAGPHTGDNKYVEAYVSAGQPTFFMRVLGITSQTIAARAVATQVSGGPGSGCIYTLGPPQSSIEGVNVNGSVIVNAPTCGIVDNGNYNTKGNALTITAATFGMSGNQYSSGPGGSLTCTATPNSCPTPGMPAAADPIVAAGVQPPSQPPLSTICGVLSPCNVTTSGTETLLPGLYNSIVFGKNSTTTLEPGIYYISGSGGVTMNGTAAVSGSGVMFYFTNGATINLVGGGDHLDMQLSAPTSGPYQGILFYQDPADMAAPSLGGDNNSHFLGTLYFPSVQLTFFGNNKVNAGGFEVGAIIADALAFSGNPTVNVIGPGGSGGTVGAVKNAVLVE